MRRAGFTLIELIVALAVFALVGTTVGITLQNGIRAWSRIHRVSEHQQQVRFALALLERDAAHAVLLTGANDADDPPVFNETTLRFVTVQYPHPPRMPRLERVLIRAEAQLDGTTALIRRSAPYPAAPEGALSRARVLLPRITACQFVYLYDNPTTKQFVWRPVWESATPMPKALPRAIRLAIRATADPPLQLQHVVDMPTGVVGFTEESP